ncbi:TPA: EpsG family protein [Photobacterium damselae]
MILFYLIFSILLIGSLIQIYNLVDNDFYYSSKAILIIVAFLLIVISGLNSTSNDYLAYSEIIKQSAIYPISEYNNIHGDFLFKLLSGFIYSNTGSLDFTFITFAFISVFFIFYIITKDSRLAFLSVLIYFSHAFLNKEMIQIRAGLASALLFVAISFQAHNKNKISFIYIMLAGCFHSSALVALIPYFFNVLLKEDNLKKISVFLLLLSCCFYIFNIPVVIIQSLDALGILPSGVNNYIEWSLYNYDLGLLNPNTIKQIIIIFLALYYYSNNKLYSTYYCYFLIGVCWLISFSSIAILAARISSILTISELILVPMIIQKSVKNRILISWFFIFIYMIMFLMNVFFRNITNGLNLGIF